MAWVALKLRKRHPANNCGGVFFGKLECLFLEKKKHFDHKYYHPFPETSFNPKVNSAVSGRLTQGPTRSEFLILCFLKGLLYAAARLTANPEPF